MNNTKGSRRKVLMIIYTFPPNAGGGVQRNLKYVKYLRSYGWEPVVLTINPYLWSNMDYTLLEDIPETVEIRRCKSIEIRRIENRIKGLLSNKYIKKLRRLIECPDHCIGWYPYAVKEVKRILKSAKIDAVYTSFPPVTSHSIGYWVKRKYGIPWISDYRDPWVESNMFENRISRIYRNLHKSLYRKYLNYADHIVVTTSKLKDEITDSNNIPVNNIDTITNGYDEDDFKNITVNLKNNEYRIVYAGMLPDKVFIRKLKSAISKLNMNKRIRLVLVGCRDVYGEKLSDCEELPGSISVEYTGYLKHKDSIGHMLEADLLIMQSWGDNMIPGKTFEYLRSYKPVMVLAEKSNEVTELVENIGIGARASINNENEMINAIKTLNRKALESSEKINENIKKYERYNLTGKLADILNKYYR